MARGPYPRRDPPAHGDAEGAREDAGGGAARGNREVGAVPRAPVAPLLSSSQPEIRGVSGAPSFPLSELAAVAGASLEGDGTRRIRGVAGLSDATPEQLAFFHNPRYRRAFAATRAGAVVVSREDAAREGRPATSLLVAENPHLAFGRISALFHPEPAARPGRHPSAVIDPSARVHPTAEIGPLTFVGAGASVGARARLLPGAVVGSGAVVGEDCVLHPGAIVRERCILGDRVVLQPGAIVGSDGFGYAFDPAGPSHVKVPQAGIARIEDDVELGANACVDRATLGETVVGRGTKIDNLVQVAHNVRIGPLGLLCAQAGVSGSTELGEGVVVAGQVGITGHLKVGDGARLAAQAGVMADVAPGETRGGSPSLPHRAWLKASAATAQLPEMIRENRELRQRVAALEEKLAGKK